MKFEYDKEADAIYVYLSNKPYSYGKELDNERIIDYSEDGEPIGVELLCVSHGVIVDDLPNRKEIENYLDKKGIKIFA
jgi:uncharacterized protein YuzE